MGHGIFQYTYPTPENTPLTIAELDHVHHTCYLKLAVNVSATTQAYHTQFFVPTTSMDRGWA